MANPIEFEFKAVGVQDVERAFTRATAGTNQLTQAQRAQAQASTTLGQSLAQVGQKAGQLGGVLGNVGSVAGRLSPQFGALGSVLGQVGTATAGATAAFGPWGIAIGAVTAGLGLLIPVLTGTREETRAVAREARDATRALEQLIQALERTRAAKEREARVKAGRGTVTEQQAALQRARQGRADLAAELRSLEGAAGLDAFRRQQELRDLIRQQDQEVRRAEDNLRAAESRGATLDSDVGAAEAASEAASAGGGGGAGGGRAGRRGGGARRGLDLGGFASDEDIAALAAGGSDLDLATASGADKNAQLQETITLEERRLELQQAITRELANQLRRQEEQNAKLADAGRLVTGLLVEGIQLAQDENTTLLQGIASRLDKELEAFAIKEVLEGGAATAVAIGNAIFNPPLAATKALEAAKHFALAAAAGGASLAIPDGGGGGGGGGSARANPAGAGAPTGVVGGGGGPSTIVVNFNSPVAEAEIGRQQERAARAARRSYGARV